MRLTRRGTYETPRTVCARFAPRNQRNLRYFAAFAATSCKVCNSYLNCVRIRRCVEYTHVQ